MKKIIIAAALVITTGVFASQIKHDNTQPTQVSVQKTFYESRKELASGD